MDRLYLKAAQKFGWVVFQGGSFGYQKFSRQSPEEIFL